METLKLKFKLHALEFEVEGAQEIARQEFRDFHDKILTNLLDKINVQTIPVVSPPSIPPIKQLSDGENKLENDFSGEEYPTLNDIKLRDLPQSEYDWLLIYAFYASEFGTKEFSRNDFMTLYEETGRKTEQRRKNLSINIKVLVKALFIKSTNDSTYIILPKGKAKVIDILNGNAKVKPQGHKSGKSSKNNGQNDTAVKGKKSSNTGSYSLLPSLNLKPKGVESLKDFFAKFITKNSPEYNLVIVYYLERIAGETSIGVNHLYTCYKHLSIKIPNLVTSLNNTKMRTGWLNTSDYDNLTITVAGENHLEYDLEKNPS